MSERCANCNNLFPDDPKTLVYKFRADVICPTPEGRKRVFCSKECTAHFYRAKLAPKVNAQ